MKCDVRGGKKRRKEKLRCSVLGIGGYVDRCTGGYLVAKVGRMAHAQKRAPLIDVLVDDPQGRSPSSWVQLYLMLCSVSLLNSDLHSTPRSLIFSVGPNQPGRDKSEFHENPQKALKDGKRCPRH